MQNKLSRREFVQFMGGGVLSIATCNAIFAVSADQYLKPLTLGHADKLSLIEGLDFEILIKWGDQINPQGDTFGFNNDYTASIPISGNEAYFWVNHESVNPIFVSNYKHGFLGGRTMAQVEIEKKAVGGSLLKIKKLANGRYKIDITDTENMRVSGITPIPFAGDVSIEGSHVVQGTLGNCAGGITPWGSFLTCEENYQDFYGEIFRGQNERIPSALGWEKFTANDPRHYGWVVEINPKTKKVQKHTNLGRFAHESATCIKAGDGRVVVYSGDDKAGEHIYKFISDTKDSLESGTLYVADLKKGEWLPLDFATQKALQGEFKNQLDVLTYTRDAAKLLGATPCDRPEDIEINPNDKSVLIALTNNFHSLDASDASNNFYGSVLRIEEKNSDPLALKFKSKTLITGGAESGIACPDNMVFDKKGNLWLVTDVSGGQLNKAPYSAFGNNSLFYIPINGENAGVPVLMAQAPNEAELTGLSFSSDFKTLFLSVQHPGDKSKSLSQLTSHWPDGGKSLPRSAVVQIYGPLLDKLMH